MSSGIRLDLPRQLNGIMSMAVTNRVFQDVRTAGLEPV